MLSCLKHTSLTFFLLFSLSHTFLFYLQTLACAMMKKYLASTNVRRERTVERNSNERSGSSTTDNEMPITSERTVTTHHQKKTVITSPKRSYYLGEDPYNGSLFGGKENLKITNGSTSPRESEIVKQKNYFNSSPIHAPARRLRSEEPTAG